MGLRDCIGKQLNEFAVGIIGLGRLGSLLQSYCEAFNCSTIWYDPNVPGGEKDLKTLFVSCDVISSTLVMRLDRIILLTG